MSENGKRTYFTIAGITLLLALLGSAVVAGKNLGNIDVLTTQAALQPAQHEAILLRSEQYTDERILTLNAKLDEILRRLDRMERRQP